MSLKLERETRGKQNCRTTSLGEALIFSKNQHKPKLQAVPKNSHASKQKDGRQEDEASQARQCKRSQFEWKTFRPISLHKSQNKVQFLLQLLNNRSSQLRQLIILENCKFPQHQQLERTYKKMPKTRKRTRKSPEYYGFEKDDFFGESKNSCPPNWLHPR